jgi:hypothetical protein
MSERAVRTYIALFMKYVLICVLIEPYREGALSVTVPLATILLVQQVEVKKRLGVSED